MELASLIVRTHDTKYTRGHSMNANTRRNAIRKYGLSQGTGLFLGYICLIAFMLLNAAIKNSLNAIIGESLSLWLFGVGGFASFLIPPIAVQWYAVRDPWLYCPRCQNFLGRIRAILKLNKESTCNNCGCKIEIAPIDKRQARFDLTCLLGGLWTLLSVSWLICIVFLVPVG